jgi:hypothetical protein
MIRVAAAGALAALAALATLSCGGAPRGARPLPRAGSAADDGTGFVARMSRGQHPHHGDASASDEEAPAGGYEEAYGEDFGGAAYGGSVYGVGGTTYPPAGPAPAPTTSGYLVDNIVESGKGGAIEGVALWKGARAPASLPAVAQATRCSGALENTSLRVAPTGGLRDAVVFLADIRSGKAAPPSLGGTLEIGQCRFAPLVQVAMPIGQVLAVTNRDESPVTVRLTRRATSLVPGSGEAAQDLALGGRGEATLLLDREAAHEATVAGGHPAASAWIVVPPHPYYTLTDEQGRFRLDDVPAGEYTLVVWHPPVVTGLDAKGAPLRTPALETRTHVKVEESKTTATRLEIR